MASAVALQLLLISLIIAGAVVTASIVPCNEAHDYPKITGNKFGKCGFLVPNNTVQQDLR